MTVLVVNLPASDSSDGVAKKRDRDGARVDHERGEH